MPHFDYTLDETQSCRTDGIIGRFEAVHSFHLFFIFKQRLNTVFVALNIKRQKVRSVTKIFLCGVEIKE